MGIYAVIQCDVCNTTLTWRHTGKVHVIRYARAEGWSVGNTIKCSSCKKSK